MGPKSTGKTRRRAKTAPARPISPPCEPESDPEPQVLEKVPDEPTQTNQRKKAKSEALYLTQEEQDDVIEWFMSNPMLYDKGHADYKLAAKRTCMWEEKAQELGKCDGEY